MKLIRYGDYGQEKPGLLLKSGERIDTSELTTDYDETFFENNGLEQLQKWLTQNEATAPRVSDTIRLGAPIARPSKIVCIGLNYADHAEESGVPIPEEPILFFKSTTCLVGPNDPVVIPKNSQKTDWEVELAIIIGKRTSYVSREDALDYVAGYALHNDYSEREWQLERGGQWVKGKSADTFAPLGPFLATRDEIAEPEDLRLWLSVNDQMYQDSSTKQMIFGISELISYTSQFMTLLPGDIISTGTPPGVGLGIKPDPVFLRAGNTVRLGIEGLGEQCQKAESFTES